MIQQQTLKAPISCKGIGLHTGHEVSLTVHPADVDHGIVFYRADKPGTASIRADFKNVGSTSFATTLNGGDFFISTVEHLMSALAGMGVDNALVEVKGNELPIMDGSSLPFAHLIASAGLTEQNKPRKYIQILRPVIVSEGDKIAGLYPASKFSVSYSIEFEHPMIKTQRYDADLTPEAYIKDIAWARTFGFLREINMMKANGLAAGGGLQNALVLGNYSVINKGGVRFPDEFVRHKILDAVGDVFLAGHRILGQLVCKKSGHALNHKLVSRMFEDRLAWRYVELDNFQPDQELDNAAGAYTQ